MLVTKWILPALLTAFFTASQDAWVKRYFSMLPTYDMMAFPMAYSLPLFCVAIPFVEVPPLDGVFLAYLLLSLPVSFFVLIGTDLMISGVTLVTLKG